MNEEEKLAVEIADEDIVEPTQATNEAVTDTNDDISSYEDTVARANFAREELVRKMTPLVLSMDIEADPIKADPDVLASQMKVIDSYKGLLNDMENSHKNLISTKLKRKDSDTQATSSLNIADFLSKIKMNEKISMNNCVPSKEQQEQMLEQQFRSLECSPITPEELEEGGKNMLPKKSDIQDF